MGSATTAEGLFRPAPLWPARRKLSFSPFDPNTPHLRFAVVSILVLWLIVLSVIQFLPKQFSSKATLIIPGATPSVSISLDRIGQTTTAPAAAYNTVALSPKVIYKEMLMSEEVRAAAAARLGVPLSTLAAPRIKLVDETALINIELRGRSGVELHRQHVALIEALLARLDRLRADELEKRTATVKENLMFYETNLADARGRITALQVRTGLQSEGQFNEVAVTLIRRTQKLAEQRADLARHERELRGLSDRLGLDPATASIALRIAADPSIGKLLGDAQEARAKYEAESKRLGAENPLLIHLRHLAETQRDNVMSAIGRYGLGDARLLDLLVRIQTQSQQADLMKQLVTLDSVVAGRRSEVELTTRDVATLEADYARLGRAAAELEDLKKSQLVAEAVFSTAMARINTTKSDIYGSYPLVQTLAAPSLPDRPGGAQGLYGIAGGVLGTLLLALGWFLAWLRTGSGQKTLKSA